RSPSSPRLSGAGGRPRRSRCRETQPHTCQGRDREATRRHPWPYSMHIEGNRLAERCPATKALFQVEIECSPCDLGTTVIAATKALSLKSAFSRLPLVQRADLEGQQRVDSACSRGNIRDLVASLKTPRFSA